MPLVNGAVSQNLEQDLMMMFRIMHPRNIRMFLEETLELLKMGGKGLSAVGKSPVTAYHGVKNCYNYVKYGQIKEIEGQRDKFIVKDKETLQAYRDKFKEYGIEFNIKKNSNKEFIITFHAEDSAVIQRLQKEMLNEQDKSKDSANKDKNEDFQKENSTQDSKDAKYDKEEKEKSGSEQEKDVKEEKEENEENQKEEKDVKDTEEFTKEKSVDEELNDLFEGYEDISDEDLIKEINKDVNEREDFEHFSSEKEEESQKDYDFMYGNDNTGKNITDDKVDYSKSYSELKRDYKDLDKKYDSFENAQEQLVFEKKQMDMNSLNKDLSCKYKEIKIDKDESIREKIKNSVKNKIKDVKDTMDLKNEGRNADTGQKHYAYEKKMMAKEKLKEEKELKKQEKKEKKIKAKENKREEKERKKFEKGGVYGRLNKAKEQMAKDNAMRDKIKNHDRGERY